MKIPKDLIDRIIDTAIALQQTPAPSSHEGERAHLLASFFQAEGLSDVTVDEIGNTYARLPGKDGSSSLVVAAHLDTVFPISTPLHLERTHDKLAGPGIGDNSIGLAGLLGLYWLLKQRRHKLPGDLWLVGTAGEEGRGNLRGIRQVVQRFAAEPEAYIILEGMGLGQIFHRGLGVRRYQITCRTKGGHSWIDAGHPSAIHHLARLITQFSAIPLPSRPRTVLNVGIIQGGTSVNTIAAEASCELDLRSEDVQALEKLTRQVDLLIDQSRQDDVKMEVEVIGDRPAGEIPASHPLVQLARFWLEALDLDPHLSIGSTDANIPLSCGYPAITIGLTRGGRAHTLDEFIHIQPLSQGMEQLFQIVTHVWAI